MDGMTIDEVIKYFDDDAKENEKLAIIYRGNDDDMAEMHKQDAIRSSYVSVWLRELKKYRAIFEKVGKILADNGYTIDDLDTIFGKVNEEVNADDSNGTN